MKRTNVFLEENQRELLAKLAAEQKKPAAEIMRRIIDFGLLLYDEAGPMGPVVKEAMAIFDDADTPERAIVRMGVHWLHDRQENSIRGSQRRMEAQLAEILAAVKK